MSATGTDDRFLRAALVEGNGSGVSESTFLVIQLSAQRLGGGQNAIVPKRGVT